MIPVRDGERWLGAALDSIAAQTRPADEVVVVDDGSLDSSAAIAESAQGVTCLRRAAAGPSAARNAGIVASSGELIAFLDADDLMAPERLELQASRIEAAPRVDCVLGRSDAIVEPGVPEPWWAGEPAPWVKHIPYGERVYPMSMMARRPLLDELGGFDERLALAEDVDLLFRVWESGARVEMLDAVLTRRRAHHANASRDFQANRTAMFRVLKMRLDRRRAAADQGAR